EGCQPGASTMQDLQQLSFLSDSPKKPLSTENGRRLPEASAPAPSPSPLGSPLPRSMAKTTASLIPTPAYIEPLTLDTVDGSPMPAAVKRSFDVDRAVVHFCDESSENSASDDHEERENSRPRLPPKRSRDAAAADEITTKTTITLDLDGVAPPKAEVRVYRSSMGRRSVSEVHINETMEEDSSQSSRAPSPLPSYAAAQCRTRRELFAISGGWTMGVPICERTHAFVETTQLPFKTTCTVCGKTLGVKSLKCTGKDCKCVVHRACKPFAPHPCVPFPSTTMAKAKSGAQVRPRLADQCPDESPKIPGAIIRCVCAIERSRLRSEGLYRIPGEENEVQKLVDEFNSKVAPDLPSKDTETITGCVKKLLLDLREPLIPSSSFDELRCALDENDDALLRAAVEDLPIPHRDTLAFLCAHWQRVAAYAARNRMPAEALASELAPVVVGTKNSGRGSGTVARQQIGIMKRLLEMPPDFWSEMLNSVIVSTLPTSFRQRTKATKSVGLIRRYTPPARSAPSTPTRTGGFVRSSGSRSASSTPQKSLLIQAVPRHDPLRFDCDDEEGSE
ncbi:RhoGAP domain containing protein, partial [Aphelenchoides avenae]